MAVKENGVKRTLPYLSHKKGGKSWFEMMEPEMLEDLGKLMMQGEKFLRKAYENVDVPIILDGNVPFIVTRHCSMLQQNVTFVVMV